MKADKALRSVMLLKWFFGSTFFLGAFLAFYFLDVALLIRVAILIAGLIVGLGILAFTPQGKALLVFFKEARQEMRKVVWPSRQETMSATLMVGIMVIITGLFLWMVDSVLLKIVAWLTGGV